jgi:NAD(P)-dependent dehydrogenase (short-subunit alcohol dehydrogenase family)
MQFEGISAVVTGGGSGLGAATARALAARGAHVVVVDQAEQPVNGTGDTWDGGHPVYVRADVTDPDAIVGAIETARALAPLRVLVNAAGIGSATRTIGRDGAYASAHSLEHFRRVVDVNLVGTFNCVRLAATAMSRQDPIGGERGTILNVASIAAFEGQVGQSAYAGSKAGIVGLTLPLARDLSAVGVRVNCIAPGLIDTPMYGQGEQADQLKQSLSAGVLFPKRFGHPAEFASLAMEILANPYMNGEVVRLDAGVRLPPK